MSNCWGGMLLSPFGNLSHTSILYASYYTS
jgi:hypothetical protein